MLSLSTPRLWRVEVVGILEYFSYKHVSTWTLLLDTILVRSRWAYMVLLRWEILILSFLFLFRYLSKTLLKKPTQKIPLFVIIV